MKNAVMGLFAALCVSSRVMASTWTIYPDSHIPERDGQPVGESVMTGPQQLTNAFTQIASGDTILVKPGRYNLTGLWMKVQNKTKTVTEYVTNHLYSTLPFILRGDTTASRCEGRDDVILCGDGTMNCLGEEASASSIVRVENITFENFGNKTAPKTISSWAVPRGTALNLVPYTGASYQKYNADVRHVCSNCVIRSCTGLRVAGVYGGKFVDCTISNCTATSGNSAAFENTHLYDCLIAGNSASADYGGGTAIAVVGCTFVGNESEGGGGALGGASNMGIVSNCTFRANRASTFGGAIADGRVGDTAGKFPPKCPIVGCRFEENVSGLFGGALSLNGTNSVIGCIFVSNACETAQASTMHGGGALYAGNIPVIDCVFSNNFSNMRGGATYGGYMTNCLYVGNLITNIQSSVDFAGAAAAFKGDLCGDLYKCVFEGNMIATNGFGGAVFAADTTEPIHITKCAFTNNFVWSSGGAVYGGVSSNCIFSGNRAVLYGAGLYEGKAVDCTFVNNQRFNGSETDPFGRRPAAALQYGGNQACNSSLVCCRASGSAYFWKCALDRCEIFDVNDYCVFYENNALTNCLVRDCSSFRSFFARYLDTGKDSERLGPVDAVNCTFVSNTYNKSYGLVGSTSNDKNRTNNLHFVNCIFWGNKKGSEIADLCFTNVVEGSSITFKSCLYGVDGGGYDWTDLGGNIAGKDPRFIGTAGAARQGVSPYTPRKSSPAFESGDASIWTNDDLDLAGKRRLRDGKVGLGCYECWLESPGFLLIFN